MPLYIRDDEVDALAVKVQELTKSRTKTAAVRLALEHELQHLNAALPPSTRFDKAIAMVDAIRAEVAAQGLSGTNDFDMKAFTDEMWGEND
ncbi:histidinol dehydrogenase [Bosea caraganae]|uniref:Histidinol dehydrogenase n=1 Tax=Bosea caraganae TaxID=2763117 RepID=A0A370LC43_9HYPH|nr:type II toxin-antitoxin system VapB family antitoxin [Bosea caraganae]RDJ27098.1 histidinol dehydrogenase [Bosea caraganae]RDJ29115.1 histidinol dehydrogenase [Bosea caraganae]